VARYSGHAFPSGVCDPEARHLLHEVSTKSYGMIFISMFAVIILHVLVFHRRGILDPVSVFLISYLYYSYFTPVTMSIFEQFDVYLLQDVTWISPESIDQSAILSFLGYAGYSAGYYVATMRTDFRRAFEANSLSMRVILGDSFVRGIIASIFITFLLTLVFFSSELFASLSSYEAKIATNYENSTFAFVRGTALILMSILANYFILVSRRYALITAASVVLFVFISFLTFSKGPFIFAVLCGFCFLYRYRKLPSFVSLAVMAGAGILALVYFVPAFAAYRATGEFRLQSPDQVSLSTIFSDASGPFGVINFVLNGYFDPSRNPLWHSFVLWVPKFIWAGRPLDIAETFAQQMMKDWQPGFGMGFSPLAEGYARFGMLGTPFFMILVGATLGFLQTFFSSFLPTRIRVPIIMTVGGYLALLVLRGAYSGVITQSLQAWIPALAVCLTANYFSKNKVSEYYRDFSQAQRRAPPPPNIRRRPN
jgi:O-antigen polysaccharide polymerase Wzy